MKLWLIKQSANRDYDTFDSAVVAAETETDAQRTYPDSGTTGNWWENKFDLHAWTLPENVEVTFIGEACIGTLAGVILGSFNAG